MKNKLYFLLTTLILWGLCNSCENQEFDSLWDQKMKTRGASNEEYVTVKFQIKGDGRVIANSESLDEFYIFQDEELLLKKGEEVTFGVADGELKYWEGLGEESSITVVVNMDMTLCAVFRPKLFLNILGRGEMIVNGETITGPGSFSFLAPDKETERLQVEVVRKEEYWLESFKDEKDNDYGDYNNIYLDEDNLTLTAFFKMVTSALFINEEAYISVGSYELMLEGKQYIDDYIVGFTYWGGAMSTSLYDPYVQADGLKGYIRNTGERTLYVETDFMGKNSNFTLGRDKEVNLKFSSAVYTEDRRLDLYITVSDHR